MQDPRILDLKKAEYIGTERPLRHFPLPLALSLSKSQLPWHFLGRNNEISIFCHVFSISPLS
jgi:hypothetical protein